MVADDNGFNTYALKIILHSMGYTVDTARNGQEALDMFIEKSESQDCRCYYEVVLMDCNMPIMDGYESC